MQFAPEHDDIREMVASFAANELVPRAERVDAGPQFPREGVAELGSLGLLGAAVPESFGGTGGDLLMAALILEELARGCASTALVAAADGFEGAIAIRELGSDEQRRRFLPPLATGSLVATVALAEPDADGVPAAIETTARRDGEGWVLDGRKCLVVGAREAGLYLVAARVAAGKVGAGEDGGGTGIFLVEGGARAAGVSIAAGPSTLGTRGAGLATVTFGGCRTPAANRLGGAAGARDPVTLLFELGRVALSAISVGVARAAWQYAIGYAQKRTAFGGPIARFEAVRNMIADAATATEAAALLVYRAAQDFGAGEAFARDSAMARVVSADAAYRSTKSAVQILGGNGFSREFPVERMYRDAKTLEALGATPDVQRRHIAASVMGDAP